MSIDDRTLQVEITVIATGGRQIGQRGKLSESKMPDPPSIPRIARLMALAIKFQDMVQCGDVCDYADLARLGYVSRARLTQIMNLLLLAPDIQEEILELTSLADTNVSVAERNVRSLVKLVAWDQQRREWIAGQRQG